MPDINPLLQRWDLPPYSAVRAEHLVPAIEKIISDNRQAISDIIASQSALPTWDDLVLAVDETDARLDEAMGIIATLDTVKHSGNTWEIASGTCHDAAAQYRTEKLSNQALFQAYQRLAQSPAAANYDESRKAVLNKILRRFRYSGIDLPLDQQQQLTRLNRDITALERLFLTHLEDASAAWSKRINDVAQLRGLPLTTKIAWHSMHDRQDMRAG